MRGNVAALCEMADPSMKSTDDPGIRFGQRSRTTGARLIPAFEVERCESSLRRGCDDALMTTLDSVLSPVAERGCAARAISICSARKPAIGSAPIDFAVSRSASEVPASFPYGLQHGAQYAARVPEVLSLRPRLRWPRRHASSE